MSQDNLRLSIVRPTVYDVDEILKAEKEFTGHAHYTKPDNAPEQVRLNWPVLINHQSDNCYISAILYPYDLELRFTINLVYHFYNIWRLDFVPSYRPEYNPELIGHRYSLETIWGPHCHRWIENRRLARSEFVPETLPFRVPLVQEVKTWDNAFRYFAGETNIGQPPQVPIWPPRDRLL